ncbi:MAG: hypothetical protein ACTSRI_03040 [Promethearchaeota archaeon]
MENDGSNKDSIKEELKKEEIIGELKLEKNELINEEKLEADKSVSISVKAILKIASHSLKYANTKIPKNQWVEVIGLLAGKQYDYGPEVHIEDAYPMGHGTTIYAEIKDYKNYVKAFKDIKKNKLFICGWYHSHPSYGLFMSTEDLGTQARYQKLWDKSVALVIDPYKIDGTSLGFEIFRANLSSKKWFTIPFSVKGSIDVRMLPEILEFMNPIIHGKAAFLEYDED